MIVMTGADIKFCSHSENLHSFWKIVYDKLLELTLIWNHNHHKASGSWKFLRATTSLGSWKFKECNDGLDDMAVIQWRGTLSWLTVVGGYKRLATPTVVFPRFPWHMVSHSSIRSGSDPRQSVKQSCKIYELNQSGTIKIYSHLPLDSFSHFAFFGLFSGATSICFV